MGVPRRLAEKPEGRNELKHRFGAGRAETAKAWDRCGPPASMQAVYFATRSHSLFFNRCWSLRYRQRVLAILSESFFGVTDLRATVRRRLTVLVEVDEHHLLDGQDALARDLVAHFAAKRDRRAAEMRGRHAEFDDVALTRRADEIDLGHELGHDALIVQLGD